MEEIKVLLKEKDMPRQWYNVAADMPGGMQPPLHPQTLSPLNPSDLELIFPKGLIEQEISTRKWIDIPEEILKIYRIWRPSPMFRAKHLEEHLKTPARIYYKYEGVSPAGSHKCNTAVAQVYYNKKENVKRIATETGAGQWGSALAMACNHFGIECKVYMVKISYEQKPYRRSLMQVWGAQCVPSPTKHTNSGRAILEKDPDSLGSLGIAISEAVEDAATHEDTKYALGSVLNHVCLHQTIIGQECKKQLALIGEKKPDVVIGCCGGGSNFAGIAFPYVQEVMNGEKIRLVGVEPEACPTLTRGQYRYDYGDSAKLTPLMPMYTLGHSFVPPGIHAGGLRYHGDSPLLSFLVKNNIIEAQAYHQNTVFEAAILFAKTEGIVCAPEAAHAVKAAVEEAKKAKDEAKEKVILFNLSGHGFFDLASYDAYLSGKLEDYEYPEERINEAISELPEIKG